MDDFYVSMKIKSHLTYYLKIFPWQGREYIFKRYYGLGIYWFSPNLYGRLLFKTHHKVLQEKFKSCWVFVVFLVALQICINIFIDLFIFLKAGQWIDILTACIIFKKSWPEDDIFFCEIYCSYFHGSLIWNHVIYKMGFNVINLQLHFSSKKY